ncbi:ParB N-terminal domain-containing protein [Arthrobacter sp. MYb213]|uniref:ParB/RepB/Spo0J family partition protein n=1 Tax=Arthrobacter sp. MYb213 TaxID=1848595 RepID=UPI0015E35C14|nr:ParB N-terminal domain-containing protein [Arthrobacter sp. MYb213]
MSKNLGDIQDLPLSAVHPDELNPREDMGDLESLAKEMKSVGQMDPITVYPHPELDGQYRILGGHRRYQAALRGDMGTIICRVIETPKDAKVALFSEALTTGTNHKKLTTAEQGTNIQGLLTEGKSEAWIARNFSIPKAEVKPRAGFASKPKLAERFDNGKLDLLAMKKLQDFEESTGDTTLVEKVTEQIATAQDWNRFNEATVERVIVQEQAASKREKLRGVLSKVGAVELDNEHRYSGKYSKITTDPTDSTAEEHVAAGHLYDVDADGVTWWAKTLKPKRAALSDAEKAEKELLRRLTGTLPESKRVRQVFALSKIRDKKALTDNEDRELFASIIFESGDLRHEQRRLIAEVISLEFPEPEGEEREWSGTLSDRRKKWDNNAYDIVFRLTLGQQVRLYALIQAAVSEDMSNKFNLYQRDSHEKQARWAPMATWYRRLINFFGYIPDRDEVDAMRLAAKQSDREIDVELPVGAEVVCGGCGQHQVIAADESTPCPTCDGGDD